MYKMFKNKKCCDIMQVRYLYKLRINGAFAGVLLDILLTEVHRISDYEEGTISYATEHGT